jgi:hypothetical protein
MGGCATSQCYPSHARISLKIPILRMEARLHRIATFLKSPSLSTCCSRMLCSASIRHDASRTRSDDRGGSRQPTTDPNRPDGLRCVSNANRRRYDRGALWLYQFARPVRPEPERRSTTPPARTAFPRAPRCRGGTLHHLILVGHPCAQASPAVRLLELFAHGDLSHFCSASDANPACPIQTGRLQGHRRADLLDFG